MTKTPTMRHGWRHDCFHVLLLFCFQISGTDSIGFHLESQRAESIVTLVLNSATVSYRVLLLWSCWKTHREGKKASPAPPSVIRVHGAMMLSLGVFCIKKNKKKTKQKSTWTYSLIFWGYNSSDLQKKKVLNLLSIFSFPFFFSINDRLLNNVLTVACKHWV